MPIIEIVNGMIAANISKSQLEILNTLNPTTSLSNPGVNVQVSFLLVLYVTLVL